jgi:hypothetical protein
MTFEEQTKKAVQSMKRLKKASDKWKKVRGKYVSGMFLLLNEAAAVRWITNTFYTSERHLPFHYPCFGNIIGNTIRYLYLEDIEGMREALLSAESSSDNTLKIVPIRKK